MTYSLTDILFNHENIAYDKKLSIMLNISSGLHYLHNLCHPAIVHHDLHSNNIFLTENLVAKIGDLLPEQAISNTKLPGAFSPRGSTDRTSRASNVFSFGLVTLHISTQKYPIPQENGVREVDRYEKYINHTMFESIKQLIIHCLNNDPQERPQILQIYERLVAIIEDNYKDTKNLTEVTEAPTDATEPNCTKSGDFSENDHHDDKEEESLYIGTTPPLQDLDSKKTTICELVPVTGSHPLDGENEYKITTIPTKESRAYRKTEVEQDDSAMVSDLPTNERTEYTSSPSVFAKNDSGVTGKRSAKPKRSDGTGIVYCDVLRDMTKAVCYIEKRGSGFFGRIHLSGEDSLVLFTNFHAVIKHLPDKHLYDIPSALITKEHINKIEKDIKTCKIFMENYSVEIPFSEILIEGSTKVSTRTELDFCMMKIDERKLQRYYDVVPITLDDDDTNRSINNGDQILILQYAKSQANHSQREPAHSTSPCRVVGCLILYRSQTERGSSGSPILKVNSNRKYSIVGLHRGKYDDDDGEINQGSAINDILKKIKGMYVPGPQYGKNQTAIQKAIEALKKK